MQAAKRLNICYNAALATRTQGFIFSAMTDSFDCTLARETLWPNPDDGTGAESDLRAKQHVEGCRSCQRFFRDDRAIELMLSGLSTQKAPASLRTSILAAIAEDQENSQGDVIPLFGNRITLPLSIIAMAAVLTLLIARTVPTTTPIATPEAVTAAGIWDFSDQRVSKTDAHELEEWFSSKFETPVMVPDIQGGRLIGGGLTNFDGYRSATVAYTVGGTQVTYVVVPTSFVLSKSVSHGDGPHFIEHTTANENTVVWGAHDTARLLVGNLPPEELMAIAERCRKQDLGEL